MLVADSLTTRHVYKTMLRILMLLMMFVLPVYYLVKIKNEYVPLHCESELEFYLNPDDAPKRYDGQILYQTTNDKNQNGVYT